MDDHSGGSGGVAPGHGYLIRRARWLQDQSVARRMRVWPLAEEPTNLRAKALATMQLQLTGHTSPDVSEAEHS
jgi:hypothetical protein